ncbi:hypothetical protein BDN72DRAFT_851216 [Pluteus cervinus]|uniref:Uncharacterized protein n=1 Tax=Pluteus cervinus TaxID=181527 RepID=A0ACD3A2E7_9AGAR|nr:hypothetical protein BDN72DRAFT_851216 [Pluteus cervinus]
MTLPVGVYKIVNIQSGLSLDLSGSDKKSIIGYEWHGGDNQKWMLDHHPADPNKYIIMASVLGMALGFVGEPESGVPIIALPELLAWEFRPAGEDPNVFRIFVPSTPFNLALADKNPTPGAPATLSGGLDQTWSFEKL